MFANLMSSPRFLRAVVWFDASTGVLLGALHLLLTAPLAEWLGLPPGLLQVTGAMLLGYAAGELEGLNQKAGPLADGVDLLTGDRFNLGAGPAAVTDQKGRRMGAVAMVTGHIGIEALNPMDEALLFQKIQSPIDGRRLGRLALSAKAGNQVIGLHRLTTDQQQFQGPPTRLGQTLVLARTAQLRRRQFGLQRLAR